MLPPDGSPAPARGARAANGASPASARAAAPAAAASKTPAAPNSAPSAGPDAARSDAKSGAASSAEKDASAGRADGAPTPTDAAPTRAAAGASAGVSAAGAAPSPAAAPAAAAAGDAASASSPTSRALAASSTLYVTDLDLLVTELHLQSVFNDVAHKLRSIRVSREPMTQRSLGYAFVNFVSPEAAREALETHRPLFIGAGLCRAFIYPGKDAFTRPGKPQGHGIFIKNLDPLLSVQELYYAFAGFGTIVSCRLALGDFGHPRGFAYVGLDTRAAAEAAIDKMNGTVFRNRRLFVGLNLPRRERLHKYDDTKENYTNLFIKGVSVRMQEEQFFEFFAEIGPIESYSMPLDEYGVPRGFGFVNYKNHADAVRAVEQLSGQSLAGRELLVARAMQRDAASPAPGRGGDADGDAESGTAGDGLQARRGGSSSSAGNAPVTSPGADGDATQRTGHPTPPPGTNLYVKHLHHDVTDEMLANEFRPFGTVISAKVMTNDSGESRGFGFVCFEDSAVASAAIAGMHQTEHWGQTLFVAPAQRRERRTWHRGGSPGVGPGGGPAMAMVPFNMMGLLPYLSGQYVPAYYPQQPWSAGSGSDVAVAGGSPMPSAGNPGSAGSAAASPAVGTFDPYTVGTWGYGQYQQQYYLPQQQYATVQQLQQQQQQQPQPYGGRQFTPQQSGNSATSSPRPAPAQQHKQRSEEPAGPDAAGTAADTQPSSGLGISGSRSVSSASGNGSGGSGGSGASGGRAGSPGAGAQGASYGYGRRARRQQNYGPSLGAAVASAENPAAEKQVIGEALYPKVLRHPAVKTSELASRLTGILLEENRNEVLQWLDDDATLNRRIQQARDAYSKWESAHEGSN